MSVAKKKKEYHTAAGRASIGAAAKARGAMDKAREACDWEAIKATRKEALYVRCLALPKEPVTSCQNWDGSCDKDGYGLGGGVQVPRFILARKLGRAIRPGYCALHSCDNSTCVAEDHLWEGTKAENTEDARVKGRLASGDRHGWALHPESKPFGDKSGARKHPECLVRGDQHWTRQHPEKLPRGSKNSAAKLDEEKVKQIRLLFEGGASVKELAVQFGMSYSPIKNIVDRVNWKHVP